MTDATQKAQLMNYLHLGALALGPLLMVGLLFFIFRRGRKKVVVVEVHTPVEANEAASMPKLVEVPDEPVVIPAPRPGKHSPMAQPISEDPQKVYIREQIQLLGKTNPATVAQLIQTWMDEDRRN
jgi:flagellar biosynthesis/type III secretory pathway M-ring protein FliF/YscJ